MSLRDKWNNTKSKLAKAGVKTSIFKKDFGPTLDTFETANRNYDKADGKNADKMEKLRAARKNAAGKALSIATEYGENLKHLHKGATDTKQKDALDGALTDLFEIMNELNVGARL